MTLATTPHSTTVPPKPSYTQPLTQSSLNISSIQKSNLWLVQSSEYLQHFCLEVRHRPGKSNIIPDALSRLPVVDKLSRLLLATECKERLQERDQHLALTNEDVAANKLIAESVSAHPVSLVQMSNAFKQRLVQGYTADPRWIRIQDIIERNRALGEDAADLPYKLLRGLIYYKDVEFGLRLCVPQPLVGEVFNLAHDKLGHQGYDRTHQRLTEGLYIYNLAKQLHAYIQHYHQCQLRQTPRHQVHGSLQPILTPPRPFHTISIDFILALPLSRPEKYDCVMSVSDKFSKAITLIPGNIAASGKVWAVLLLDRLSLMFWGLPRAILSDRDRRFVGQLWQGIFDKLSVSLLYSTSYHPQTDGMSERTNQTVEIALRYYLSILPDMYRWPTVLPRLSHALCNSKNFSSTGKTPTQVLYGFKTREPLDFLRVEEGEPVQLEEGDLGYHSGGDDLQDCVDEFEAQACQEEEEVLP